MEVAKEGGDGTLAPPEKMAAAIIEILGWICLLITELVDSLRPHFLL